MASVFRIVVLTVITCSSFSIPAHAGESPRSPKPSTRSQLIGYPIESALRLFRQYISPVDGHRCPMAPSCSNFATGAVHEFGLVRGSALAADRLHRCGHDLYLYPSVQSNAEIHWVDTVSSYANAEVLSRTDRGRPVGDDINYLQFLERMAGLDFALLESFRLIHEHASGIARQTNFDQLVLDTGERILRVSGSKPDPLQYYKAAGGWGVKPASAAELRLIVCQSLMLRNRWLESEVLLGEEPFFHLSSASANQWYFLKGSAGLRQRNWAEASSNFAKWEQEEEFKIDYSQLAFEGFAVPVKSPALAGVLSIVPGLGYAYTGHNQTAIAALLVVGLTVGGVVEAVDHGNTSLAVGSGLLCLGWYSGSIIGAVESAHRRNEYEAELFWAQFPRVE